MNVAIRIALIVALAFEPVLATSPSNRSSGDPPKSTPPTGVPNPRPQVGGDTIGTATVIPVLPYTDGGNTCGYFNDYDATCPFVGSTSPDVVYSFAPAGDLSVDIDLCGSSYDTKVYVYENTPGSLVACNDDACSGPNYPNAYLSDLICVPFTAGSTYYIVVDGYGGSCGNYVLWVTECLGPCTGCPPGSLAEGEPDCTTDYVDHFNGGCNSTPNVFSSVPCPGSSVTICGTYGGFLHNGLNYRDTDWYQLDVPPGGLANVTICALGTQPTLLGYIDGSSGCPVSAFVDYTLLGVCEYGCLDVDLPPGPAWIWMGVNGFGPDYDCGSVYWFTIDGLDCPVSVKPTSWAEIKAGYGE